MSTSNSQIRSHTYKNRHIATFLNEKKRVETGEEAMYVGQIELIHIFDKMREHIHSVRTNKEKI